MTARAPDDHRTALAKALAAIVSFDVETIRRSNTEGETFAAVCDAVDPIVQFARHVPTEAIDLLPPATAQKAAAAAHACLESFENARRLEFHEIESRVREFGARHANLTETFAPVLCVARFISGWPAEDAIRRAGEELPKSLSRADEAAKRADDQHARLLGLEASVRAALGAKTLRDEAKQFEEEAESHERRGRFWLGAVVALSVVLVLALMDAIAWHRVIPAPTTGTNSNNAAFVALRLSLFATLATLMFAAIRQFSAERHNAVINRHRANSLAVYGPLLEVRDNDRVRDIIVTHAAASIFAPQPTGLSRASSGDSETVAATTLLAALGGREKPGA